MERQTISVTGTSCDGCERTVEIAVRPVASDADSTRATTNSTHPIITEPVGAISQPGVENRS